MTRLTLGMALFASLLSGIVIFLERFFPFALFSRKEPPRVITFIEKYIPSMVIAVLVVYSLKNVELTSVPYGASSFIAIAATALFHLTLKNPMVSIFGGTAVYMVLSHLL